MIIGLLHLSDIHFRADRVNTISSRARELADATNSRTRSVDHLVVAVSGDIAYSGKADEYSKHAEPFIEQLLELLRAEASRPAPDIVLAPGNHDCDFSRDHKARAIILQHLRTEVHEHDEATIAIATEIQADYFNFAASIRGPKPEAANRLVTRRVLCDGALVFRAFNTAWLSRLKEGQGTLAFPIGLARAEEPDAAVVVSMFHHPYNWLESNNARAFRKEIESSSDVILTGHEHDPDCATTERTSGANITYLEGGVLQSSNPNESSFNILLINVEDGLQQAHHFSWSNGRYRPLSEREPEWTSFQANRSRQSGFAPNARTQRSLDDPNVQLTLDGQSLSLSDLYVFPDIRELAPDAVSKQKARTIPSEEVPNLLLSGKSRGVLVVGESQSGKTALCQMLVLEAYRRRLVPLLLSGATLPDPNKLEKHLEDCVLAQFDRPDVESFRQLPGSQVVFIIDEYHLYSASPEKKARTLSRLSTGGALLLLVANDTLLSMEGLTRPDASTDFPRYRICPLGHANRNQLVERWLALNPALLDNTKQYAQSLRRINQTLDEIIGHNFVPAYPPYVLAVLQAADAAIPVDTKASSHGYFYELFIQSSLARGRSSVQYDILISYLSFFAFQLFCESAVSADGERLAAIHALFEERHDLTLNRPELTRELLDIGFFRLHEELYSFRYPYLYYYFVAYYLRDHIHEGLISSLIQRIAKGLHVEGNANIMLFLAHLTKDPSVIKVVVEAAREMFSTAPEAKLQADSDPALDLEHVLKKSIVTFRDGDTQQNRRNDLQRLDVNRREATDEADPGATSAPKPDAEGAAEGTLDPIVRIGMAFKTLQILGQIARNFPGSLDRTSKSTLVSESVSLGLRTLGSLHGTLHSNRDEILSYFVELVRQAHPGFSEDKVFDRAKDSIVGLVALSALGMIKRVSMAVGSVELNRTYDRIFDPGVPSHQLIRLSIDLDHAGQFPRKAVKALSEAHQRVPLVMWVTRALVVQHLRLFPVELSTKQSVCQELEIEFEQTNPASSSLKLLK